MIVMISNVLTPHQIPFCDALYKKNNKNFRQINDFDGIEFYIKEYCAFGCKYFILEKIEVEK